MKQIILAVSLSLSCFALSHAQKVIIGDREVAEIKPTGEVSMSGKVIGIFETNGDVYKRGELVGVVKPNGEFWASGTRVGKMELDGTIMRGSKAIGKVEPSGKIWENGEIVGTAAGVKKERIAAFYFFYFKEEVAAMK